MKFKFMESGRKIDPATGVRNFSFRIPFYCVLYSGLWSGFMNPPPSVFSNRGKAPKEAWGGNLSGEGINVIFLQTHEPQLSAMRCVTLTQS